MSHIDHIAVTGRQLAAARTLVGLTQAEVAAAANISVPTLKRMERLERGGGPVAGLRNNVLAVVSALEAAGVQFLDTGDVVSGAGVALRS
jgi:transcriptional regulator with XRE-family HTH domain